MPDLATFNLTPELRQQAQSYMYGKRGTLDGRAGIFTDIRAAVVQADGRIIRTMNGDPMAPGTALFAMPNDTPPRSTIESLLAVIDAQEVEIARLDVQIRDLQFDLQLFDTPD